MKTAPQQPSSPLRPWYRRRAELLAVLAAVLAAAGSIAAARARESRRADLGGRTRDVTGRMLTRDLPPGTPLAVVTAYLRRQRIAFTVDSGGDGPVVAGIGRVSSTDGAITQIQEIQIGFNPERRLRAFRTAGVFRHR